MGGSSAPHTARCAPLPRTAAVLSFRVRRWVDRVTSKRRKQKSRRLLQGCLLRRILVHSCLLWRLVPPLKRSLPVLRLRVSLVAAFMPVRGVIRGCGPKVRTTLSGEGGDLAVEEREPTEPLAPTLFFCAITRRGRCTSGGRPAGGLPSGDSQCLRACHSDSVRQQRRFSGDTRCVGTAGRQ
ncbi:surface protease GP63 [Trypanosoma cruzi]|nr:surface protease GP63 [Trypanosoma cruzi]